MYDYILVGAGLYNAVFAQEATRRNKTCLIIEKRNSIGGNCRTECIEDIVVHLYGAHIFRTSEKEIWDYVNQFATFNHFVNSPIARYHDELYNLPFNMNTFSKMWNIVSPKQAMEIIREQSTSVPNPPRNLEEHAIAMVGTDIYEKLVKGYTEKQWGRACSELPVSIIRRIPLRFTYDNNYFNDTYQGIPVGGYTPMLLNMFRGCEIRCNEDYLVKKEVWNKMAKNVIYTGTIDSYFDYQFGELEYRSLRFETEILDEDNYQGVAVVNYTAREVPYTRIIEHKHFEFGKQSKTVITKEFPMDWDRMKEPYYPINDEQNARTYARYQELAQKEKKVHFGGRLGEYRYYDMQDAVRSALALARQLMD